MKLFLSICLLSLLFLNPIVGFSQKEVEISGVKYILHTVKKSETVFSLCQQYKVTQTDLKQANPWLTAVLQAGTTVKIPVSKVVAEPKKEVAKNEPAKQEEFYYHKVNKKQTIFSIAKQYGVTANDLIRNNPELTNGLVLGQVIKVPVTANSIDQKVDESSAGSDSQTDMSGFTIHPVVSGETLFNLEQRYEISHEEMLKFNPALQNGLKTGMKLKIPVKLAAKAVEPATAPQTFTNYQVGKGETLYSISTRFGVEVSDLKNANPSLLSRSLESGETILIPQQRLKTTENTSKSAAPENPVVAEPTNCLPLTGKTNPKYKAALLLPLYLAGNDQADAVSVDKALLMSKISFTAPIAPTSTDTTVVLAGMNIDQRAAGFLEFYEGALLAIDSLQRKGMDIELYVFDVSNQKMVNVLVNMEEFRNMNLIIGPVYPELQETVASFAAKNRIPMISPLSPAGNFELNNSWYFKANPSRDYQIEESAAYAADELSNTNFILLQSDEKSNSGEAKMAQICREKLVVKLGNKRFHEYSFQKQGVDDIKPLLDETGENVFIIPTDNEAKVSIAVTNLNALAENYNIILMGTPNLFKLKSIPTESFHRIRMRFLSPYFTDYKNPVVRRFVLQYRETFSTEPTQFSYQGFDVSYYFLSALYRYGRDFKNCLSDYPMELTQMSFNFAKVAPMGGYMNEGLFVTSYERNFDVLNLGTIGGNQPFRKK